MPSNTTLATLGIEKLRGMLRADWFLEEDREPLIALCDYAEAQISARNASATSGGKGRAAKLPKERRAEIAKNAANKRWGKENGNEN